MEKFGNYPDQDLYDDVLKHGLEGAELTEITEKIRLSSCDYLIGPAISDLELSQPGMFTDEEREIMNIFLSADTAA